MIEVENTDVNIVRNLIPMRNHMPASAYGLKAISDWLYIPDVLAVMIDEPFLLRKIELRQNLQKILGKENASFFTCLRIPLLVLCGFKSFIEFFRDFKFYLAASIE